MEKLTVFTAKKIITMDPGRPEATAIAVSEGRIVSVGSLESLEPWLRRVPHEIDHRFAQQVLLPGFIDPHTHLRLSGTYMGLNYVGPIASTDPQGRPVPPLPDRDAVLDRLRALVAGANQPADGQAPEPIVAWGYDPGMQGGHLDRDMLDEISPTIPLWVMCYAPHIVYTNSPMIDRIGVTPDSRVHGLGRYADGRLNGWFIETEAVALASRPVRDHLYAGNFGRAALKLQGQVAVNSGVTTTADMIYGVQSFEKEWADHEEAMAAGELPLRVFLVPFEPTLRKRFGDDLFAFYDTMATRATDQLAVHGVKFINDGSYPSMTLRLTFPGYLDGEQGLTGEIPWADLVDRMMPFWERGIQIHSHANGDETVGMTLDTLAALQKACPRFDHRFTIEHYCISTPAQARRLEALGGQASVNPYFVHFRSHIHADSGFGPDRTEATARLGSLRRAGVPFALHSDYNLVVAPMHPLTAAWIAVNRLGWDGTTVQAPGERISVEDALRAITIDAAFILGKDDMIGSLEAGKWADFAVLGDDPLGVDPKALRDIPILGTVLAGKVYEAAG